MKFGFIGFGEVGRVFSRALREKGGEIFVYDVLLDQPRRAPLLQEKIRQAGAVAGTLPDVASRSDCLVSVVTTEVAKAAAQLCSKHLKPGQVYLDLNSTSPTVKVNIGRIVEDRGAEFVEGAVLGAVGATGANTRILLGGRKGPETAELLSRFGLNADFYSSEIGKASMFKMLRSIFSKGLETLLLELLIAGKRAGIEQDLWDDITDFMEKKPFAAIGGNWIQTHAVAYERRYHEMVQVTETMREIGIEPIMTDATTAFFKRSLALDLDSAFPEKPNSFEAVVAHMEKRLRKGGGAQG